MERPAHPPKLILFDGVCNFCNYWINVAIRSDNRNRLHFAPMQSNIAKKLMESYGLDPLQTDSFIYIEEGKAHLRSTAVLRIARQLRFPFPLLYAFIVLPRFIRDSLYDAVARNRYRFWGKRENCMVPTEEVKAKFIF